MTGKRYYEKTISAVRQRGNYFKSTRANMTSWHDPNFSYVLGKQVSAQGKHQLLCSDGMLHCSTVPTETLTGTHAPFLLFEAHLDGTILSRWNVCGAPSLTLVRPLPLWMAFGPNGRAVLAAIDLLKKNSFFEIWTRTNTFKRNKNYISIENKIRFLAERSRRLAAYQRASFNAPYFISEIIGAIVVADLLPSLEFAQLYRPLERMLPIEHVREHGIAMFPIEKQPS